MQVKLRNAARGRLMRMIKDKSVRKSLDAPEWLKQEWHSGDKNAIAELLVRSNFNKDFNFDKWNFLSSVVLYRVQDLRVLHLSFCYMDVNGVNHLLTFHHAPPGGVQEQDGIDSDFPQASRNDCWRRFLHRKWDERRPGMESVQPLQLVNLCSVDLHWSTEKQILGM